MKIAGLKAIDASVMGASVLSTNSTADAIHHVPLPRALLQRSEQSPETPQLRLTFAD